MSTFVTGVTHQSGVFILVLLSVCLVLAVMCIKALTEVRRIRGRFKELLQGARGETLELILHDHLNERLKLQEELKRTKLRVSELEARMQRTKGHLGLVRYDAFEDVGGAQSFALAFCDDEGDGAVLTSLVGRADCRVYCKPLSGGTSERNMSEEEQRAVREATGPEAMSAPNP